MTVRFHVLLGGFFRVILGLNVVAVRQVGVVSGGFVIAVFMMLGGFMVMARSVLVVLRCLLVMLHCFVGHEEFLPCAGRFAAREDYRDARSRDGLQPCEFGVKRNGHSGELCRRPVAHQGDLHELPSNQIQRLLRGPLPHAIPIPTKRPVE